MSDNPESGWSSDDAAAPPMASPSPAAMPQRLAPAPDEQPSAADDGDLDFDDPTPHDIEKQRRLRNEARNLRERAKAAEGERDALRAVVDGIRASEVARLAAAELVDARDLTDRHDLEYFLDEAGNVDPAKVTDAAQALIADRPHVAAPPIVTAPPSDRPLEGLHAGASPQRPPTATTWKSALGSLI